jgi:putative endonuclease
MSRTLLSLAGFQVIITGRFWVIAEDMTGFLMARVLRHRAGEGGAFTRKYRVHRLVYYRSFQNVGDAIARETEIKKWRREKKVALIRAENPTWEDLAAGWGEAAVMTVSGKAGSSPGAGGPLKPGFGLSGAARSRTESSYSSFVFSRRLFRVDLCLPQPVA